MRGNILFQRPAVLILEDSQDFWGSAVSGATMVKGLQPLSQVIQKIYQKIRAFKTYFRLDLKYGKAEGAKQFNLNDLEILAI